MSARTKALVQIAALPRSKQEKEMSVNKSSIAIAITIGFSLASAAAPAFAQAIADQEGNAHHYQGGPQTGVPHATKHTQLSSETTTGAAVNTGHHYSGGPKDGAPHHMGEKK
jgi:hypothetical protein